MLEERKKVEVEINAILGREVAMVTNVRNEFNAQLEAAETYIQTLTEEKGTLERECENLKIEANSTITKITEENKAVLEQALATEKELKDELGRAEASIQLLTEEKNHLEGEVNAIIEREVALGVANARNEFNVQLEAAETYIHKLTEEKDNLERVCEDVKTEAAVEINKIS